MTFEWYEAKNQENVLKHNISFEEAQEAFFDEKRVIISDNSHSTSEERFFCIGNTGFGIATVRFTIRNTIIRIFGAGYWRKEKKIYETRNYIH
ncbi:MAG: BrnT family toxin [Bacteroidales bacterium]|jgi:uncharacterized DUF497 family protein|nr:BrnT family toxin [Bacteroidales bacterium]